MAMPEQSLGLCLTCNNSSTCLRREGIRLPVLFCEDFDDSTPRRANRATASAPFEENAAFDTAMGLCCNCGNRGSCTLCHAPGGVWHCEEYC